MICYTPPVEEYHFLLAEVFAADQPDDAPQLDDVLAIWEASARFATQVMLPLRASGDREGCAWADGQVRMPAGYADAYARYQEGGWSGLDVPQRLGGIGMPDHVATATWEFQGATNPALDMFFGWGSSAAALLGDMAEDAPLSDALARLVTGEWCGSMALSEPGAGSDLGQIRTRAEPLADGSYALHGGKIYNSGGEHDLAANIIHFVLARVDGAGLTLFAVPKFLLGAGGSPGARNPVQCLGIEAKMGLHANPTCSMAYDGAIGLIVGEPGQGLQIMFRLMNHMRRRTGAIALGASEIALQSARAYARERIQGRAIGASRSAPSPLAAHPDVRRLLIGIAAFNTAARALLVYAGLVSQGEPDDAWLESLLTPVIKGFFTEQAMRNCLDAQQIFGGHGYIAGAGIEQVVRDARMLTVAEGATAIQANDLVFRKLRGNSAERLAGRIRASGELCGSLARVLEDWTEIARDFSNSSEAMAGEIAGCAVQFLELTGWLLCGWMWQRLLLTKRDRTGPMAAQIARQDELGRWFLEVRMPAEAARCIAAIKGRIATRDAGEKFVSEDEFAGV